MPLSAVLLSLDVSSTVAGWACFRDRRLAEFGVLRPSENDEPADRMDAIVSQLRLLIPTIMPREIVMEWSAGKVHGRKKRIPGLAVMGQAQGAVRQALIDDGQRPVLISENDWTGGTPKEERALAIVLEYPDYAAFSASGQDKGMDAADAIGLAHFHLTRSRLAALAGQGASSHARRWERGRRR